MTKQSTVANYFSTKIAYFKLQIFVFHQTYIENLLKKLKIQYYYLALLLMDPKVQLKKHVGTLKVDLYCYSALWLAI